MKRYLFVIFILTVLFIPSGVVGADTEALPVAAQAAGYFGPPLCRPGMVEDGTCLFSGPAQTVAEMQAEGFPYPPRDLPAATPSEDLGELPVFVAKINLADHEPALIYSSFEDAVAGTNPVGQIAPGTLRYISYVYRQDHNGNPYLQLASGGWLRASPAAYTDYQGLVFYDNPRSDFGWIVDATPSYRSPSFSAELTGENYVREDVIQVFGSVEAESLTWYRIAPDEWVNSQKARVVQLDLTPPEEVTSDRWIEINLEQQTMTVYEDGQLQFATLAATGLEPFYTQPGVFQIYEKKPLETMQGAFEADHSDFYYLEDVPWTMYFDQARALHAAYWRTFFGYPQSHGCVNLSPGDAKWLFEWADEGDFVWVHDPSGQTPIDPDYYGPGAP
jgi:hypothetical protein